MSEQSAKNYQVHKLTREQLPACCPTKDDTVWNQHPRVYIELDKSGHGACPYCGNQFELTDAE